MTLKEIRFYRQLSQWKLSRMAQVHQSRLSLIENGFSAHPAEKTSIITALGINPHEIDWPADDAEKNS
ncbi:MAG: XRE family transcriptional regulator [Pseudomonadota bacterium]